MLQLGNGILFESEGRKFRFDPKHLLPDEVGMISHAHSDHLPTSFKNNSAICSPITREFVHARVRRKNPLGASSDARVEMLDAGHIAGSTMFLVKGETEVLYTGDFCTREKRSTAAAAPHKCDVLITEATYGKPEYIFPPHDEIMSMARDWLQGVVNHDGIAVLYAYPLGKSQELAACLKDLPIVFHKTIAANNRILKKYGYELPDTEFSSTKPPFIYVTSGMGNDALRVAIMKRHGAQTGAFSGWALDHGFNGQMGVDESFPVSDHCGFNELMEFVRKCDPDCVYTNHGFTKEFAGHIRRQLGISAQPLMARQKTLDHFNFN